MRRTLKKCPMQSPYIKGVIRGLIIGGIALAIAGAAGFAMFLTIGITQLPLLVTWLPPVLIAVFVVIILAVLLRDASARKNQNAADQTSDQA